MAKVDLALLRLRIPGRHKDIVHAVLYLTRSSRQKAPSVSSARLSELTGLKASHTRTLVSDLVAWGILERRGGGAPRSPQLFVVEDTRRWHPGRKAGPASEPAASSRPRRTRAANGSAKKDAGVDGLSGAGSLWTVARKAFSSYGKRLGRTCSQARARAIKARLEDHRDRGPEVVAAGVHGYMAFHGGRAKNDFDPMKYFTPETVFRPSKFERYLEAYDDAIARGLKPPFHVERRTFIQDGWEE